MQSRRMAFAGFVVALSAFMIGAGAVEMVQAEKPEVVTHVAPVVLGVILLAVALVYISSRPDD